MTALPGALERELAEKGLESDTTGVERQGTLAIGVQDASGKTLGYLVRTKWSMGKAKSTVWWTVSSEGPTIKAVQPSGSQDVREAFLQLAGKKFEACQACSTGAGLAGCEILSLVRSLEQR